MVGCVYFIWVVISINLARGWQSPVSHRHHWHLDCPHARQVPGMLDQGLTCVVSPPL